MEDLTRAQQIILRYLDSRYKDSYDYTVLSTAKIRATFEDGKRRTFTINLWGDIMDADKVDANKNHPIIAVGNVEHELRARNVYALPTKWKDV